MASMSNAMMERGITPPSTFVYDGKIQRFKNEGDTKANSCLLYTSPSPRD